MSNVDPSLRLGRLAHAVALRLGLKGSELVAYRPSSDGRSATDIYFAHERIGGPVAIGPNGITPVLTELDVPTGRR